MGWIRPDPEKANILHILKPEDAEHTRRARISAATILGLSTGVAMAGEVVDKTGVISLVGSVSAYVQMFRLNRTNEQLLAHDNAVGQFAPVEVISLEDSQQTHDDAE